MFKLTDLPNFTMAVEKKNAIRGLQKARVYLKKGNYSFPGIGRECYGQQAKSNHLPGGREEAYCSRSHAERVREASWGTLLPLSESAHLGSYSQVTASQFMHSTLVNTVLFKKKKRTNTNKPARSLDV